MKEITTGNGRHLFVPIPKEAYNIEVIKEAEYFLINYSLSPSDMEGHAIICKGFSSKDKYPERLTLLFTTDNVTEEQAAQVVDKVYGFVLGNHIGFEDYTNEEKFYYDIFDSFHSFKIHHSLTAPRYAVLKIN
jgi:hypothetical protein